MKNDIVENQKNIYGENFNIHGPTPRGTFQNNIETQNLRFSFLMKNLLEYENSIFSIHDVGVGLADLHQYLDDSKIEHTYSGTEIVEEMVDFVNKRFPNINISNRNILNADDNEIYDYVVLSGTLNLRNTVEEQEWKDYAFLLISKMFKMAKKGISFNFLTTYKTLSNENLFYLDPKEIFDYCMTNLSRFVSIDHAYPLYEATITVFKEDFLKEKYDLNTYGKYFK